MSAIFGIIRFDGAEADAKSVTRMGATMRHRAPDGTNVAPIGPACLGHGKMRVQREDIFDAQPLGDDRGEITLVFEGRLDNRDSLAGLCGIDAATLLNLPDSALVLAAYQRWGTDCPEHLLGDFAIAVWDGRNRKLLLARDHMGQRHLLFHLGENFLAFASEIKGLWAIPEVPRALNDDAVMRRMLVMRDGKAPATLFDGIDGLRGGETMLIGIDRTTQRRRYWTPRAAAEHEGHDEAYYIDAYRRVLGEAVACRVRRLDRRPALHMSGGFDSSAIAGLAGPVLREQGRSILGISSVMPESRRGEFARDARIMVEYCARDMPHLDVHFMTREGLPPFGGLDEALPMLDGPASTVHYVYQEAARIARREGIRQLMDGHGGDYTLNPRDTGALPRLLLRGRFHTYWQELRQTPLSPVKRMRLFKAHVRIALEPLANRIRALAGLRIRRGEFDRFLLKAAIEDAEARGIVQSEEVGVDAALEIEGRDLIARALRKVSDRVPESSINMAAWAEGLTTTRPFHDKRVVELALAIPQSLYSKNGRSRHLARTALADIYPAEFQGRPLHNDRRIPDWEDALSAAGPDLVVRAQDLPDDLVDRAGIADALQAGQPWDDTKSSALNVLMVADYRRWFNGRNAS